MFYLLQINKTIVMPVSGITPKEMAGKAHLTLRRSEYLVV